MKKPQSVKDAALDLVDARALLLLDDEVVGGVTAAPNALGWKLVRIDIGRSGPILGGAAPFAATVDFEADHGPKHTFCGTRLVVALTGVLEQVGDAWKLQEWQVTDAHVTAF